jgi:hypothetical protein
MLAHTTRHPCRRTDSNGRDDRAAIGTADTAAITVRVSADDAASGKLSVTVADRPAADDRNAARNHLAT